MMLQGFSGHGSGPQSTSCTQSPGVQGPVFKTTLVPLPHQLPGSEPLRGIFSRLLSGIHIPTEVSRGGDHVLLRKAEDFLLVFPAAWECRVGILPDVGLQQKP